MCVYCSIKQKKKTKQFYTRLYFVELCVVFQTHPTWTHSVLITQECRGGGGMVAIKNEI